MVDSKSGLANLEVDCGMMDGEVVMEVLADVSRFEVVRPEI